MLLRRGGCWIGAAAAMLSPAAAEQHQGSTRAALALGHGKRSTKGFVIASLRAGALQEACSRAVPDRKNRLLQLGFDVCVFLSQDKLDRRVEGWIRWLASQTDFHQLFQI
jgi:hypothetical protein